MSRRHHFRHRMDELERRLRPPVDYCRVIPNAIESGRWPDDERAERWLLHLVLAAALGDAADRDIDPDQQPGDAMPPNYRQVIDRVRVARACRSDDEAEQAEARAELLRRLPEWHGGDLAGAWGSA